MQGSCMTTISMRLTSPETIDTQGFKSPLLACFYKITRKLTLSTIKQDGKRYDKVFGS